MEKETSTNSTQNQVSTEKVNGGKFLTFFLQNEEYGIEILRVQEIIGLMPITRIPRTPDFVRGVINLRGKIIAVTDLRKKFGMEDIEQTSETCIIVVQTNGTEIGVMVDKVSEVLDIADAEIEPTPAFGASVPTEFLLGIGNTQGGVRLLLNIEKVLSDQQLLEFTNEALSQMV
ncbi:MAG: chemotaxis protein CheW [Pyrinomonadaceae bacterium]